MPIETFNISFESRKNRKQYGIKITCTEVREKVIGDFKNVLQKQSPLKNKSGLSSCCKDKNTYKY